MRAAMLLAVAGALGTLSRYGVSLLMLRWLGPRFPYGTLTVNVLGAFLMALVLRMTLDGAWLSRPMRLALTTGFMGAFTTFSTFGYETMRHVDEGAWRIAGLNVAANLTLGLGATWLGLALGRALTAR